MGTIVRNEVIEPAGLSPSETEALIDSLYGVHCEIFDGVSRDAFASYVVRSPADHSHIQMSYGETGELAGYIAVHAFRRVFRGEACTVTRAEAGLRRAYRGNGSPGSFFVSRLLKTQWKYGGPHYYLGCLVHPSSYTAFARDGAVIWPSPDAEIPKDTLNFMMQLGEEFHLEKVDKARPLVRHVGWITKDSEVERRYWQTTEQRAPRFFIEQNPGYGEGHGLLTLFPLDASSLGKAVVNWSGARIKKSVQRTVGALERSVIKPRMDDAQAAGVLSGVEAMTGLNLESIKHLGVLGTRWPVPARTVLFRAGDAPDAMYMLISGSVFVLDGELDADGNEVVIDQLGPNTLVGEMALLTERPRTATVRTAVDSLFLRLTKSELDVILNTEPRLADQLWRYVTRRVFALQLRAVPVFAGVSWEARFAWFSSGSCSALGAGERSTIDADGVLVHAHGRLLVEGPQGWMTLTAPALCTVAKGSTVTALAASRIAVLPPKPPRQASATRSKKLP